MADDLTFQQAMVWLDAARQRQAIVPELERLRVRVAILEAKDAAAREALAQKDAEIARLRKCHSD